MDGPVLRYWANRLLVNTLPNRDREGALPGWLTVALLGSRDSDGLRYHELPASC